MKSKADNFLDFVPVRRLQWDVEDGGQVCLHKEKTRRRWLKSIIGLLRRSQFFHIHLDELGSAAWLLADGRKSVMEIAGQMVEKYGDRVDPVFPRVSHFFAIMKRNDFVSMNRPPARGNNAEP